MKRIYLTIIGLSSVFYSYGQSSVEAVLDEISRNNPELKAAAAGLDMERLDNRSETLLENPEIEFNYLWGADNIGGRHDVRISQAFDIPTLTGMKSVKAACMDELSALKYDAARLEVMQEARRLCVGLVYYNKLISEFEYHLESSSTLVESYGKRLAAGDATILDLNKAKLHMASVKGRINEAGNERQALLSRLKSLNGGQDIDFDEKEYDLSETLPVDFESWFEEASRESPVLGYVRKEVELGRRQLAIDRTSMLPELSLGYMSEIRTVEKFRGMTVGVNIPLWSGANKVKRSRAGVAAAESRQNAAELGFYYRLKDLYRQAASMKANYEMLRDSIEETDNRDFLLSALTKGEISMIDYLVENDLYYDALERTLDAEREYRTSLAALKVF